MNDTNSLSHATWNCKYHIVFAPKYRRKVFYGEKRKDIGAIPRQLCVWKGVEIHEAEVCPDHVHILVSIPPKLSVASFMGFLKGKSSLLIYQKMGEYEIQVSQQRILVQGILVDTVGKNTALELYLNEFEKALKPIREEFPKFKLLKDIFDERNKPTQKTLVFSERQGIEIIQEGKNIPLEKLSSGEKNDLIMFYLLIFVYDRKNVLKNMFGCNSFDEEIKPVHNKVSSIGCLVLIDEPELSLHIEWQESFLDYLITIQAMNRFQSIVATHSPNIINDHLDLIAEKR